MTSNNFVMHSRGLATVTLPDALVIKDRHVLVVVSISPDDDRPISIVDERGRLVKTLRGGDQATFKVKRAPWWRFWDIEHRWVICSLWSATR